jgi:hypothetical protein
MRFHWLFAVWLMVSGIAVAENRPLKVFVLAGQSNMQGHANVSTFDGMADDPKTAPLLKSMLGPDGKPKVCDKVWITSVGGLGDAYTDLREKTGKLTAGYGAPSNKIGPEFTFGLTLEERLGEPILIVKTAWGGRSLHTDFRPPSAGAYPWSDAELAKHAQRKSDIEKLKADKIKDTGFFYKQMIAHVKMVIGDIKRVMPDYDPKQGFELAGFVWFQGFNDFVSDAPYENRMKPGGYDIYADLLAHLIRDVRKDLSAPKMPFVVGVMGIDGEKDGLKPQMKHFRDAQRKVGSMPEFQGNTLVVETAPFWDDRLAAIDAKRAKVSQMEYLLRVKDKNQANKDGNMTKEEQREFLKKYEAEIISVEEATAWKRGASNGGYHYLGSAKTLGQIGKAFAEALLNNGKKDSPKEGAKPETPKKVEGNKPVKVFLLAGQSNMEGHGFVAADPKRNDGKGSLEYVAKQPATASKYRHLLDKDGKWIARDDVWIHYLERKGKLTAGFGVKEDRIGPELGFGTVVGDAIEEPVLLIKLAWGGKSLGKDFRPPSSGGEVGPFYREIVQRSKAVLKELNAEFPNFGDRGYELVGFGWHQGWNDRINRAFNDEYEKNLANFIRDIRKDLGVAKLPFVVAETGMTGPNEKHPRALSLMKAQAAVANSEEFQGNVAFVATRDFWREKEQSPTNQGYHWNSNAETYYSIGEAMGQAMKKLIAK